MNKLRKQVADTVNDITCGSCGERVMFEISDADELITLILNEAEEDNLQLKSTDNERMWKEKYDYRRGYLQAVNDQQHAINNLRGEL